MDVGVYFLQVEEDAGERGGEVERGVGYIVGCCDESVCEGGGGEGGGEEGFVVDVGGLGVGHGVFVQFEVGAQLLFLRKMGV